MGILRFFVRNVLGVRGEDLPWAKDFWEVAQAGDGLRIDRLDLAKEGGFDPTQVVAMQLRNHAISGIYVSNEVAGERRETMDLNIPAGLPKHGGAIIRFTDGQAITWQRPFSVNWHPVPERERFWYTKLLQAVREAARAE